MYDKIAVILDKGANVSSFGSDSSVFLFVKVGPYWQIAREIPFAAAPGEPISSIRSKMENLTRQMKDCKIIAGKSVSGLAFHILDRMEFQIFEIDSLSDDVLDGILFDISSARTQRERLCQTHTGPVQTDTPGHYFLDLISLQRSSPEISSKQALQPFLRNTPFLQLELVCSHVPPWLENNPELTVRTVAQHEKTYATIIKKCNHG